MRRILSPVFLALLLARSGGPPPALACDDVLAALIEGRDEQTQFEVDFEKISSGLDRVISQAREGNWEASRKHYRDEVLQRWIGIYKDYLRTPPPSLAPHPDWVGALEGLSGQIATIRKTLEAEDLDALHPAIDDLQYSLVRTYMAGWNGSAPTATAALVPPVTQAREQLTQASRVHPTAVMFLVGATRDRLETLSNLPPGAGLVETSGPLMAELEKIVAGLKGKKTLDDPKALALRLGSLETRLTGYATAFLAAAGEPTPPAPE